MHIIIDGYNLIRQSDSLRSFERINLEEGRKALVRSVSLYRRQRGHRVTIVFDGWENGPPEEERDREEGIHIIYSRRGEKADEVIKRMVQRRGEEIIVVTSDRGIADFVNRRGGVTIPSREFESLVNRTKLQMSANTCPVENNEDGDENHKKGTKKKGPSKRLSRKERVLLSKVKKL
ncbi:MAG: NYN domain-containing protein [Syntrophales bacterium]|nr:NYN domain-containing protein [Syntrophales bacterium]